MVNQIPTSAQIADEILAQFNSAMPFNSVDARELLINAARAGKAAGLQIAQNDLHAGWPQGQYDRFNEHQFAARLKKRLRHTMGRLQAS